MGYFFLEKTTFIFYDSFGTCRRPQDHRKIFFENLLNLASLDAEFDADSEFRVRILKDGIFIDESLIYCGMLLEAHFQLPFSSDPVTPLKRLKCN
jgi:hypothetical protein